MGRATRDRHAMDRIRFTPFADSRIAALNVTSRGTLAVGIKQLARTPTDHQNQIPLKDIPYGDLFPKHG
jgi:hypothetical protein